MKAIVLGLSLAALTAVAASGADAKTYTATFPCKAEATHQTVKAGKMEVPLTTQACDNKNGQYSLSVSDFPKGFIAKKTIQKALKDTVTGAAANVGGTVRSEKPATVAGIAGRDAIIDIKKVKIAVHMRVFFVGDRQYQVVFAGAAGQENSKAAADFLDSVRATK